MIVRRLDFSDVLLGRLDALLDKRVRRIPVPHGLTPDLLLNYVEECLAKSEGPEGTVPLVADDGEEQLAGILIGMPVHMIGDPIPVMGDLLAVATRPGAMDLLVGATAVEARRAGCKHMILTAETACYQAAVRWGERHGAKPVAVTLFKEV